MFVSAIVPAAGLGLRLSKSLPKPLIKLNKKPILIHTLNVLSSHPAIKEIILVVSRSILKSTSEYLKRYRVGKIKKLVIGGSTRTGSVREGLRWVDKKADLVLIHDAVRPFIRRCGPCDGHDTHYNAYDSRDQVSDPMPVGAAVGEGPGGEHDTHYQHEDPQYGYQGVKYSVGPEECEDAEYNRGYTPCKKRPPRALI